MPPVDDIEVHEKVRKVTPHPLCYNRNPEMHGYWVPDLIIRPEGPPVTTEHYVLNTSTKECRQIGRRVAMDWSDLPECEGCKARRDWDYIYHSRDMIDGAPW